MAKLFMKVDRTPPSCLQWQPLEQDAFMGYECGATFASARGARVHYARVHLQADRDGRYIRGSACHACCCEFHTRTRLEIHLRRRQRRCLRAIRAFMPPMTAEDEEAEISAERERRRQAKLLGFDASFAEVPMLEFAGPAIPPASDELDPFGGMAIAAVPAAVDEEAAAPVGVPLPRQASAVRFFLVLSCRPREACAGLESEERQKQFK